MSDLDLSQIGERLTLAATKLLAAMPESLRAEFVQLAAMGDELDAGLWLYPEPGDLYAITWQGRWIGSISGEWLRTGVAP
jgi:hypothetical protein